MKILCKSLLIPHHPWQGLLFQYLMSRISAAGPFSSCMEDATWTTNSHGGWFWGLLSRKVTCPGSEILVSSQELEEVWKWKFSLYMKSTEKPEMWPLRCYWTTSLISLAKGVGWWQGSCCQHLEGNRFLSPAMWGLMCWSRLVQMATWRVAEASWVADDRPWWFRTL